MDIYINPTTNDIDLTDSKIRLVQTEEELIRQRIQITLATYRGEWFANINFGIPYLENPDIPRPLLSKSSKNILDFEIQRAILATDGVIEISSYTSTLDQRTRKVTVDFSAVTESGEIVRTTTIV